MLHLNLSGNPHPPAMPMQLPKHVIVLVVQPKSRVKPANFTERGNTKQGCRVQRMNFSLRQACIPARQIAYPPRPNTKRRKQLARMGELRDDSGDFLIPFQLEREVPHLNEKIQRKLRILVKSQHPVEAFAASEAKRVIVRACDAFVEGRCMVEDIRWKIFAELGIAGIVV